MTVVALNIIVSDTYYVRFS